MGSMWAGIYFPHMGYTCGIHIGNENRFRMGPIWDLSGIQYGTHVFLRYITRFPYGYHMNARCFPDGSHVNPGLIRGFLDVFY